MTASPNRPDFTPVERELAGPARRPTSGVGRAGRAVEVGADWLGDRIEDGATWLANLVRYLPVRLVRVTATIAGGLFALLKFGPAAVRIARVDRARTEPFLAACARRGGTRVIQLLLETLDVAGVPEIFAFVWRLLTRTSPLTGAEIEAAASVLGTNAVRYQAIRVAQGGVLKWVFARNGHRAFATFHTINLPEQGSHQRANTDIIVHEIVHVYQYERAGSRYFAEALLGQHEEGYDYGGSEGLRTALRQGKQLRAFNREQQAQIVQDYYLVLRTRGDVSAYEPFIRQMREGAV